jgi:hypothetical protein
MPANSFEINPILPLKKAMDICRRADRIRAFNMKNETINTVLTYVLGIFALLGVIFALQTIFRTREYRSLVLQASQANNYYMRIQALGNDAVAFNQKNQNPDLARILSPAQTKPAAH